jgi:hypothetical protein
VSIQYHALKGAQLYTQYLEDVRGHHDVEEFIRRVQREDAERAARCHDLLSQYTKQGITQPAA